MFESDEALQAVTERYSERENQEAPGPGERQIALEACMNKLTETQRSLLDLFYQRGESHEEIARREKRRANTIAVTLHRIRQSLAECINRTLSQISPS